MGTAEVLPRWQVLMLQTTVFALSAAHLSDTNVSLNQLTCSVLLLLSNEITGPAFSGAQVTKWLSGVIRPSPAVRHRLCLDPVSTSSHLSLIKDALLQAHSRRLVSGSWLQWKTGHLHLRSSAHLVSHGPGPIQKPVQPLTSRVLAPTSERGSVAMISIGQKEKHAGRPNRPGFSSFSVPLPTFPGSGVEGDYRGAGPYKELLRVKMLGGCALAWNTDHTHAFLGQI